MDNIEYKGWIITSQPCDSIIGQFCTYRAGKIGYLPIVFSSLDLVKKAIDQEKYEAHCKECVELGERSAKAQKEYKTKHPNYCRHCFGWGGHIDYYDPSPAGVSLSPGSMVDFDPCPECYEKGICPQCSEFAFEDIENPPVICPRCGWNEENPDGLPESAECFCSRSYEDEI